MGNFNIRAWYKGAVAAATALLGVGAVADEKGLLTFALGLLLFGLGEWINHPFQTKVVPPMPGFPHGAIGQGESRSPKFVGLIFDGVGLLLMCGGLYGLLGPIL